MKPHRGRLHRNAIVAIATEPLWAVFGTAAVYYLPLYMKVNGLTDAEIGLLVSCSLWSASFAQFFAGPVTNRLGRRNATFIFDMTAWVLPTLAWGISGDFWVFLLAYVLNGTSKIVNVSFWLLATEGSPSSARANIFAAIRVIILFAGLLVPLEALAMQTFGEEAALRALFVLGGVAMLVHNVVRHALSVEPEAGLAAMREQRRASSLRSIRSSLRNASVHLRAPAGLLTTVVYAMSALAAQLCVFQVVFLTDVAHFPSPVVGSVPAVVAVVSLVMFGSLLRRKHSGVRSLTWVLMGTSAACAGWWMFSALQTDDYAGLFISAVLFGAGTFLTETYRETLILNNSDDQDRADVYAAVQLISAIAAIPAGLFAGLLFTAEPRLLFVVVSGLYLATAVVAFGGRIAFRATR